MYTKNSIFLSVIKGENYFSEILQEIQGTADSLQCSAEHLSAVLFSMYCMVPRANCSCFAARAGSGVIFSRNSDFLTGLEKFYMHTLYRFAGGSYSFNGNTTAFVQMEDGINEYGLAVGLTSVTPTKIKLGINAGMLVRLFLKKCKTVSELISLI